MSDSESHSPVETEEQFWEGLAGIVSVQCPTHESIDDALRSWLYRVANFRDHYLSVEDDVASCSQKLLDSAIFRNNKEYVRTQIIYSLLQEDDSAPLHVISNFLLLDGRSDEATFRRMIDEGCFPRLLELINGRRDQDRRLHRLLLELMYEMSRIERLRLEDLLQVDDGFVTYLFRLIEAVSDDLNDPYHYPVIRVLLVLNEQYMVAATTAAVDPNSPTAPLTNRVVKILGVHGPSFRTFGENLILLLNRETETSLQLLILKLLYLIFTTKATYEYFYTNDLRVLLDVIVRNLLDLPNELMSLRHTYLRVLYPLLAHTQLSQPPHYKRDEIVKVLKILGVSGNAHFAPADETTLRLVDRVSNVEWLSAGDEASDGEIACRFLGISLSHSQAASSVSVVDVAAVMEKPGVQTPSRKADFAPELKGDEDATGELVAVAKDKVKSVAEQATAPRPKRVLPEVPKHRHGLPMASQKPTLHVNGKEKKLPPQLPPPRRRTKLKPALGTGESLAASEPVASDGGPRTIS